MTKRHLDEMDNYDYLASNSNLPEVVVTAKAPYSYWGVGTTFANDATRVNNNPLVSVINNNSANSKIAANTLLKQARDNQLRLDREREYKNRLKRKAELEQKVAQQNRGRIINPSPIQAVMDADNLQTSEAIELAKMNREDEAAESNYINSLGGLRGFSARLSKVMGVTGADVALLPTMINAGRASKNVIDYTKNAISDVKKAVKDRYLFSPNDHSFTRGVGMGTEGLEDIKKTGIIRGNPRGTEVTANQFAKLFRRNRDHFRDIVKDTKIEGIENRYFSRTLTKEDFDAIQEASKKYLTNKMIIDGSNIQLIRPSADPLYKYSSYDDYLSAIKSDIKYTEMMPQRIASGEVTPNLKLRQGNDGTLFGRPIEERFGTNSDYVADGTPLSYWYSDGRNPLKKGYDYAGSNYAVRVNNPDNYVPFMHELHLHPSFFKSPQIADPNVELFGRGPFGITVKLDKNTLKPLWKQDLYDYLNNIRFGDRRSLKSGGTIYIKPENRGKFNATKERTGKTTEELTHSKNPLTRKRAIFVQNAAKWKH